MQLLEQRLAPLLQQQLKNDVHVKSKSYVYVCHASHVISHTYESVMSHDVHVTSKSYVYVCHASHVISHTYESVMSHDVHVTSKSVSFCVYKAFA